MRIQLVGCERQLLQEIADKRLVQRDVALTYAMSLTSDEEIDWPKVNRAIIDRWSLSGLKRVKDLAWKIAEGKA